MLINEQTWDFVRRHADEDVRRLALQGSKEEGVDLAMALQQIAGRQTAKGKLPTWAAVDGVVYPPHLNMEQCSSEQTARYKARLAGEGDVFIDLTGGLGVDFYFMSQGFRQRVYVEQNDDLCLIADHNFGLLGQPCTVVCGSAADYLSAMEGTATVIYLDPARRNEHGGRTYDIRDCTPNVLELLPLLLQKARRVILKLSPMLDWRKAVEDIEHAVVPQAPSPITHEVHIISVNNECKELVLVLGSEPAGPLRVCCVNNDKVFQVVPTVGTDCYHRESWPRTPRKLSVPTVGAVAEPLYLYEPNASVMKAGCFVELEQQFAVQQVAPNSHLFLSADEIGDFPGRRFQILAISPVNQKKLKHVLTNISPNISLPLESANIAVRNFPLTADQLRKKLKMKDGGDTYIFATTRADGTHSLFICRKIS